MSDFREYSKVINVERGFFDRRMFLKLDCGHEVYRYKKVPPKLVRCEFCHRPAWFPAVEHPRALDAAYRHCPACEALLEERSVYCDVCGTDTPHQ